MANNGLTPKQNRAIAALITSDNNQAAAEAAGVAYRTLTRWLTNPEFNQALRAAETDLINDNIRALVIDLSRNRETLTAIRDNTKNPPSIRLRAAIALDASAKSWRDLQNIETRIAALETVIFNQAAK